MIKTHTLKYDPEVTERLKKLPDIYDTDGDKGDRPAVKLFDSQGQAFWILWEYNEATDVGFGYAELGFGQGELGYVPVGELRNLGYRIERDAYSDTMVEAFESRGTEVPHYLLEKETQTP